MYSSLTRKVQLLKRSNALKKTFSYDKPPIPCYASGISRTFGMEVLHEFITTGHRSKTYQSRAKKIFDQQFEQDPRLEREMDDRRKRLMFQDILYNFDFLSTAVQIGDEKLFTNYAVWLYELLCNLMKDLDRDRVKDQMVHHYEILKTFSDNLFEEETMIASAKTILDAAIDATEEAMDNYQVSEAFLEGRHLPIRRAYLNALLRSETQKAIQIIEGARKDGLSLEEIYEDVIRLSMQEVGELWYQNKITVDKEHYATSTTQMILARFYPYIFNQKPIDKKILTCCIGSELHEMGGRMVADLFEYRGWESVYLGAAVPIPSLVSAVAEHQPIWSHSRSPCPNTFRPVI